VDPAQALPAVEVTIKAQYRSNTVTFHDGNVDSIAARHQGRILGHLRRAQDIAFSIEITSSTISKVT
jgi:hypothetical protein